MSGDVQPRKRKDKRRKKGQLEAKRSEEYMEESAVFRCQSSATSQDDEDLHHANSKGSEEVIHIQKDQILGGNACAKIIFFCLLGVLGVMVGLIITEYRGSGEVDSTAESPWSLWLEGWIDEGGSHHETEVVTGDLDEDHENSEEVVDSNEEENESNEDHSEEEDNDGGENDEEEDDDINNSKEEDDDDDNNADSEEEENLSEEEEYEKSEEDNDDESTEIDEDDEEQLESNVEESEEYESKEIDDGDDDKDESEETNSEEIEDKEEEIINEDEDISKEIENDIDENDLITDNSAKDEKIETNSHWFLHKSKIDRSTERHVEDSTNKNIPIFDKDDKKDASFGSERYRKALDRWKSIMKSRASGIGYTRKDFIHEKDKEEVAKVSEILRRTSKKPKLLEKMIDEEEEKEEEEEEDKTEEVKVEESPVSKEEIEETDELSEDANVDDDDTSGGEVEPAENEKEVEDEIIPEITRRQTLVEPPEELPTSVPPDEDYEYSDGDEEEENDEVMMRETIDELKAKYQQQTPDDSDMEPTEEDFATKRTDSYDYSPTPPESDQEEEHTESEGEGEEEEEEEEDEDPLGKWRDRGPDLLAEEVEDIQTWSESEDDIQQPPVSTIKRGGPMGINDQDYEKADITNEADLAIKEDLDNAEADFNEGDLTN
uniref:Uncharacterized protein n=1 Tax=Clastoptera arizonana TaxID=38151 RepID=A0A1B6D2B4_9HEMI